MAVEVVLNLLLMYLKYSLVVIALLIVVGAVLWLWAVARAWLHRARGPD
ncbi:MAG TPA: hypothetical protein VFD73_03995 [Gemmatimonadales bacterium]|jgi:hypothetical protein|nr:hypothetical protein [Gemmatimonadales bacterium]